MKKIFTLLSLLLFVISSASAQKGYTYVEKSVDEILSGKDHKYVLRQSNNSSTTLSGFVSSKNINGPVSEVDEGCIFKFIKVGEISHVDSTTFVNHKFNVYVLKNEANGLYLGNRNQAYTTIDKAFQFTAQKAVFSNTEEYDDWFIYSKSSNGNTVDKATDDGLGSWVFCAPDSRYYLTFRMGESTFPFFEIYRSHDAWQVYEVKERVIPALEKLTIVYNDYFKTKVTPENFPVGNSIGCINSQAVYDDYKKVYDEATAAIENQNLTDAEYDALRLSIIESSKKIAEATIPFTPGYYLLINTYQNTAILDPQDSINPWFYGVIGKSAPENFQYQNSNYIWKISASNKEGYYDIQNFKSLRYIGDSRGNALWWKLSETPKPFKIENIRGQWFSIKNTSNGNISLGADNYGAQDTLVRQSNNPGRILWKFEQINPDSLEILMEPAKQSERNKVLAELLESAKDTYYGEKYGNHFTPDGVYAKGSVGNVNEKNMVYNSKADGNESELKFAFDGNLVSYFHTQWNEEKAPHEYHWLQIDLGKEMKEFYIKYSQHKYFDHRNMPVKFDIAAPEEGISPLKELPFNDTIAKCEATHFYPSTYDNGITYDSITVVEKVVLNKPAQNIRFVVKETRGNLIRGGVGPVWAVSEFRIYDGAETVENPKYAAVTQITKDELKNSIDIATAELAKDSATQVTIDNLNSALDNFWKEFTITDDLAQAVVDCQYLIDHAVEATANEAGKPGYFEAGAKAKFQVVVDKVRTALEGQALDEAAINQNFKEINEAKEEFYNNFITIQEKGIYQIVSRAGYDENNEEYAQNDACLISTNADVTSGPKWNYKHHDGTDGRLNTLWYVEKTESGYSFKNLANGLYINNVFEGLTGEELEQANDSMDIDFRITRFSKTPKHFQLRPGKAGGQMMIALTEGQYLAMRNDYNRNTVHYFTIDNAPAQFELIKVIENDFDVTSMTYDVEIGKTQILTLPFAINYVTTTSENPVHKVLGLNGNYVRLDNYKETETIPAGCPFIVQTLPESEQVIDNAIVFETPYTNLDELVNIEYNYSAFNQNGLISAPQSFELEPGYGFLFNNMVLLSSGGELVKAGSGFFNNTIPATKEEGVSLMLAIDEKIEGDATAVEHIDIIKNANTDVYNISGVKVKNNVKVSDAAKGLAKGIYIMNGKKFIVK